MTLAGQVDGEALDCCGQCWRWRRNSRASWATSSMGKATARMFARLEGMQGPPRLAASGNTAASVTVTSLTMAVQLFEYVESVRQTAEPSRETSRTDLSNLPYVFLQIILSDQNAGVLRPRVGRVWLSTIGTQLQAQDWEWFLAMNRICA